MTDDSGSWVAVAVCLKPHALRGLIKLKALTRSEEELVEAPLERVFVRRRGRVEGTLTIEDLDLKPRGILAAFREVPDRTAAEKLSGVELVIPEDELWPAPEGSWYSWQLEGLAVHDLAGDRDLGPVIRVAEGAANDMLVVKHPDDSKREVLIPLVPMFVTEVSLENSRITVSLPEGLMDI